MLNDVALVLDDSKGYIDIALNEDGSDLLNDPGLETSVLISHFSDQRVPIQELPQGETRQRGWWGDMYSEVEKDQIGSKFWTKARSKASLANKTQIEETLRNSLSWMIEDGVASLVTVRGSYTAADRLELKEEITRPDSDSEKFALVWNGQALKRG